MNIVRSGQILATGLFAGLTFSQYLSAQNAEKQAKPNILFILSDDHSAPFVSSYGYPSIKTPNIDRLAKEGILFRHAYTAAPQCVPSRASLLTGRSAVALTMTRFSSPLPREAKTTPDYLRELGYFTGVGGRTFHLDGSGTQSVETSDVLKKYNLETFKERVDFLKSGPDSLNLALVQEFLGKVPDKKPFYFWLNYSDPHRTFTARKFEPDPSKINLPKRFADTPEVRIVVDWVVVKNAELTETITVSGTVKPSEETVLVSEVSGRITQINLNEGELIKVSGISQFDYDQSELQINSIKGDIEVLKAQIRKTEILAPYDGVLGLRNVSLGTVVSPAFQLVTIRDVQKLKIDFSVPEKYSGKNRKWEGQVCSGKNRIETNCGS